MVERGDIIAGRFVIEESAGSGGVGTVYRAHDRGSNARVALKLLHESSPDDEARFAREAELLSRVSHPNIVRYVAHGVEAMRPWLAMQWIDGETLSKRIRRDGPLDSNRAIDLGIAVAEALCSAHDQHAIHRDLKPSNLMLPADQSTAHVLLLDFGIAHIRDSAGPLTQPGFLIGTPGFVSPEQALASHVDARSDIFSLGCVLHMCLTGRAPFRGDDVIAILAKVVLQGTPRIRDERPDIDPELDALIAKMMAKDVDDRVPTARAAADALRALRGNGETTTTSKVSGGGISRRESRLCSVVLASGSPDAESIRDAIAIAQQVGGEAVGFADGRMVAKFVGPASPDQLARAAADCALRLSARFSGIAVSLATVRSGLGSSEYVADAIDRAAELANSGETPTLRSSILIDETSARFLEARFEVSEHEGRFHLIGARPGVSGTRRLFNVNLPYVGRALELTVLDATLAQAVEERVARAVLVVADAGMGKSRLRDEWLDRVARTRPIQSWHARADPMGSSSAFSLVQQAIRGICEIQDDDDPAVQREKLSARLAEVSDESVRERIYVFVAELIAVPLSHPLLEAARIDRVLMADQLRRAFEDWIELECRRGPLLFVLDDLHWSDQASIRLVDGALARAAELPFFVLAFARARIPRLWEERCVQELPLDPLSARDSERLVVAALGADVPRSTLERVVSLAAGNPYFLEELVRSVGEGVTNELPQTILSAVEIRLERLAPEARRILRAASIFGQTFWRSGLALLVAMPEDELDRWLKTLEELGAVVASPRGRFADEHEFVFRHALVRDASYATLTEEDRWLGHRVAREWLATMGEDAGALIAHFERSGSGAQASTMFWRAARQMLDGNELGEAIRLADRGLECDPDDETRVSLATVLMDANRWAGNVEACAAAGAIVLRHDTSGSDAWTHALHVVTTCEFKLGAVAAVHAHIAEGKSLLATNPARPALVAMGASLATTAILLGRLDVASDFRSLLSAASEAARTHPSARAVVHSFEAFFADAHGDLESQVENFEAAAVAWSEIDNLRNWTVAKANAAYGRALLGEFEEAERALSRALSVAERLRVPMVIALLHVDHSMVLERLGRLREAKAVGELAIRELTAQGDRRLAGACRLTLSRVHAQQRNYGAAIEEAERAVVLMRGARRDAVHAFATLAYAQLKAGRTAEALASATEGNSIETGGSAAGLVMIRLIYAQVLAANGRAEEAQEAFLRAHGEVLRQAAFIRSPETRTRFLSRVWENDEAFSWPEAQKLDAAGRRT